MKKEKLWTKKFLSITGINFFLMLTFYLLMVTISVFAVDEFHASASSAGLASSIFVIGALFGRLIGGKFIERVGRKKLLVIGISIIVLSSILYFGAVSYTLLLLIRLLHGFAFGLAGTATGTIVASVVPASRKGEGIGYFALSMTLATAVGPFVGLFILDYFAFKTIFVFCLVCVLISLILSLLLKVHEIKLTASQLAEMKGFKLSNFIEKKAVPISLVATAIAFCYSGVLSFLTFFAEESNLTEAASFFFVVYAIAIIITRPFTGRTFDKKGPNSVLYPAIVFLIIGMFILSQSTTGLVLLVAGAIFGIGYGTFMSSAQAAAIKSVSSHRVGLATSTYFILTDIGLGMGPFIQGFLVPKTGYSGLFLVLAVILVLCLPLHYLLYGQNNKRVVTSK